MVQEAEYIMDTVMAVVGEIADTIGRDVCVEMGDEAVKDPPSKVAHLEKMVKQHNKEVDRPLAFDTCLPIEQRPTDMDLSMRWMVLKHLLPMGLTDLILGGMSLLGLSLLGEKGRIALGSKG